MHIKKLVLKNYKKFEDFNAEFARAVYFFSGKNEEGKSSLLGAIGHLLSGDPRDVLRKGAEKGMAKIVVGDDNKNFDVELKFSKANPNGKITITTENGMKSDRKSMLQEIFGYSDFDAVEFSRWSETAEGRRKQVEAVKALLPVEVREKIDHIDTKIAEYVDLKKESLRDLKNATSLFDASKAELSGIKINEFENPVDVKKLLSDQEELLKVQAIAKSAEEGLAIRTKQLGELPGRISEANKNAEESAEKISKLIDKEKADLKAEIERLEKLSESRIKDLETGAENVKTELANELEAIEADRVLFVEKKAKAEAYLVSYKKATEGQESIADKIEKAELHNNNHKKVLLYKEREIAFNAAKEKDEENKDTADKLAAERKKLIEESKLPIPGLEFSEKGLTLNGIDFEHGKVSDSQIMNVAFNLVVATNPKVNVFCISRGESLDEDKLRLVMDVAKENGFQGFIEEVRRGQDGLMIEEYTEDTDEENTGE